MGLERPERRAFSKPEKKFDKKSSLVREPLRAAPRGARSLIWLLGQTILWALRLIESRDDMSDHRRFIVT